MSCIAEIGTWNIDSEEVIPAKSNRKKNKEPTTIPKNYNSKNIDGITLKIKGIPCAGSKSWEKTHEKIMIPAIMAMDKSATIIIIEDLSNGFLISSK